MATSNDTSEIPYGYCHCGCGQKTKIAQYTDKSRNLKMGEPCPFLPKHSIRLAFISRFWSRVAVTANPDKCWEWQGFCDNHGYGRIAWHKKPHLASRILWELTYGVSPGKLWVLHKCDNPKCVNPRHLFLGTRQDNIADMYAKGRQAKGEMVPNHKLSASDVLSIRKQYSDGGVKFTELAAQFNVDRRTIHKIIIRTRWAWL